MKSEGESAPSLKFLTNSQISKNPSFTLQIRHNLRKLRLQMAAIRVMRHFFSGLENHVLVEHRVFGLREIVIAENLGVTRQTVHRALKSAEVKAEQLREQYGHLDYQQRRYRIEHL